jgi:agmatine deiminase
MAIIYRMPAEFEQRSDVFVTWPPEANYDRGGDIRLACVRIIEELLDEVQVHVNCAWPGAYNECLFYLQEAGIDHKRLRFSYFEDGGASLRDFGPTVMLGPKGRRRLINLSWNQYGFMDKEDPQAQVARRAGVQLAAEVGVFDIVNSPLVSIGGGCEFNGQGTMIAIAKTVRERLNPDYSLDWIESEYRRLFRLDRVIWIPEALPENEDFRGGPVDEKADSRLVFGSGLAGSVDQMCRFVAPHKVLLAEVDEQEAQQDMWAEQCQRRLLAAKRALEGQAGGGEPLEIVRMPMAEPIEYRLEAGEAAYEAYKAQIEAQGGTFRDGTPWPQGPLHLYAPASYCDFLACNNVVLGQRYYHDGMDERVRAKDEQAERVLQECFPERRVVMIDALDLSLAGGGVHRWTKDVAAPRRG